MKTGFKKRLLLAFVVYWFLLLYIIAALVWWFISLERQNRQMVQYKLQELNTQQRSPVLHQQEAETIRNAGRRNTAKYIGEGCTFLALILIGAGYVYRAVRRQIRLQQQQEQFMMAVTHELKTPIAVAKLNLETLQKYQLEESKRRKLISATLQETNRLNDLANNILVSAQLEASGYRLSKEELNLSALLESTVTDFKLRFPERRVEAAIEPDVDVNGDPLLLQIMINNLLENAMKYSPGNAPIRCTLETKDVTAVLHVIDEGQGIPASEKKKVFRKFYRIGNELTRTTAGTGLGLYLCSKIAKDHGGIISISDNAPAGCNFAVHLPKSVL